MLNLDNRKFTDAEEKIGSCRKCGTKLVVLPEDKRRGYCFDCFDILEI